MPPVSQEPSVPPVRVAVVEAPLTLERKIWLVPGRVEPSVEPVKFTAAPVVRVRVPIVSAVTVLVVAAAAVAVRVLKPVAAVTPAPEEPIVSVEVT